MQIEQTGPTIFRVTLHVYELATLVAAARAVVQGPESEGELTAEARMQLSEVLHEYDRAFLHCRHSQGPGKGSTSTMPRGDRSFSTLNTKKERKS
jgi:hypothetical protein